jgi:hypothetical protein
MDIVRTSVPFHRYQHATRSAASPTDEAHTRHFELELHAFADAVVDIDERRFVMQ